MKSLTGSFSDTVLAMIAALHVLTLITIPFHTRSAELDFSLFVLLMHW